MMGTGEKVVTDQGEGKVDVGSINNIILSGGESDTKRCSSMKAAKSGT